MLSAMKGTCMTGKGIDLRKYIRDIPDWPVEGILFRDITPLLADAEALAEATEALSAGFVDVGIEYVAAVEARGFIFGSAVAEKVGAGFVPIRKKGKLPWKTISETYALEYGEATLEMHTDAVNSGERVLIVDDLLATGGTAAATARLIERQGGIVEEIAFVIELSELEGRNKLKDMPVFSLMSF